MTGSADNKPGIEPREQTKRQENHRGHKTDREEKGMVGGKENTTCRTIVDDMVLEQNIRFVTTKGVGSI